MFFAKSILAANEFEHELRKDTIKKIYLARVCGNMKLQGEEIDCTKTIYEESHAKMTCDKLKSNSDEGKASRTVFQVLFYDPDSNTSVVRCLLYTG